MAVGSGCLLEERSEMIGLLVAEDELIERMVLKKTLEKKFDTQCRIFEAQNGKEALETFDREDIKVAIMDIDMPGIGGLQAAETMRRRKPQCRIIFLTAYDRFDYAKRAISMGAMEYLLKPYSSHEILEVTGQALGLAAAAFAEEEPLIRENPGKSEPEEPARLSVMASMVEEYLRSHYMYEISMRDAAEAVNYSEPYFCKMFKQQFGRSFTSYLTELRIREAKKLLWKPNVNVKEIGVRVGYPDSNYFTKVFRRVTGLTPSEYRTDVLRKL